MTLQVFDTFTGTGGIDIDVHTPNTDVQAGGWTSTHANSVELNGGSDVRFVGAQDGAIIDVGGVDQYISLRWTGGGSDNRLLVTARCNNDADPTTQTCYEFNFKPSNTGAEFDIRRRTSGTASSLTTDTGTVNNDEIYLIEFSVVTNGATVELRGYVNGSLVISHDDSTGSRLTTGNYAGFSHATFTNNLARIYDFWVDDAAFTDTRTLRVSDTFTGAAGDLISHTPTDADIESNGWGGSTAFDLDGSGAVDYDTPGAIVSIDTGFPDHEVTVNHTEGGADNPMSIFVRHDGTNSYSGLDCYQVIFDAGHATHDIRLGRRVNGAFTEVDQYEYGINSSNTYEYKVSVEGVGATVTVKVSVDGTEVINYPDTNANRRNTKSWDYVALASGGNVTNTNNKYYDIVVYDEVAAAGGSAAVTGTATASIVEADVVAGGKTIIITLTGDTWVAAGATFDAVRQDIIDGLDAASSPAGGWNSEVRDNLAVGTVVRTSDTVVTITLSAQSGYNISAQETITVTVPASALVTSASPYTATPTFTVDYTPYATLSGTALNADWKTIRDSGGTIIVTLVDDTFIAAGTGPIGTTAQSDAFVQSFTAAASPAGGWNNQISLDNADLTRDSNTQATITIPATGTYNPQQREVITGAVQAAILTTSSSDLSLDSFTIQFGAWHQVQHLRRSGWTVIKKD